MLRLMRWSRSSLPVLCALSCLAYFAPDVAHAFEPPKTTTLLGPELTDRERVLQALNRLAFGPKPGQIEDVLKNGGWEQWFREQMQPDKIDDSAVEKEIHDRFPWSGKEDIMAFKKACPMTREKNPRASLYEEMPQYVLLRAVKSNRQFNEVMVEFWRNHFCVDMPEKDKSRVWTAGHYEEQVIRKYTFGKFKNMLYASATHPAMLEYLDNALSKKNDWNENFAREVMELHTVGADVGYGDDDVRELSKALTGWTYDDHYHFVFESGEHQPGTKYWMGFQLPEGKSGGEQALYTLATCPACANFISLQLCRYLVNDNPSPALVKKIAKVFLESDGDLPKVYTAIVMSPDFMSRENFRSKFKTPFEFTVSVLRATDAKVDDLQQTATVIGKMGQPIYNCPDPTGYRFVAESWMDAGVLTSRWDYAWRLIRGQVRGVEVSDSFIDKYAKLDPAKMQSQMVTDVIGADIGDREKKMAGDAPKMLSILLGSPTFQQQ